MATTKTSAVVEARRRAREAKAVLDAERAQRDAAIEEKATEFYAAVVEAEELRKAADEAGQRADAAVLGLLELGETADRVATLTGLSTKDVRRIKRETPAAGVAAEQSA